MLLPSLGNLHLLFKSLEMRLGGKGELHTFFLRHIQISNHRKTHFLEQIRKGRDFKAEGKCTPILRAALGLQQGTGTIVMQSAGDQPNCGWHFKL